MIALVLCILALIACYWAGRRSLGQGLVVLLTVGYFYGIVRANLLTTLSHFIFDAGLLGFYLSQHWTSESPEHRNRLDAMRIWTGILIAWPILLVLMPFQPLLVSLVGLRGNMFFLPVLLLGSRLKEKDLLQLAGGLAVLNLGAFAVAGAEYFLGVLRFFPYSPVTRIIYASGDVAGGFFRIPAIFSSAAAYGGTMVGTLPYLVGGWDRAPSRALRMLALIGIVAALSGVLMSATRLNFVIGCAMVVVTVLTTKMNTGRRMVFLVVLVGLGLAAMTNVRFQRFKSLSDAGSVAERLSGSVNRNFLELLTQHPLGNGLGGGGSSIPYFLEGQVRNPIGLENQYTLILCEQGVIGLLLWVSFVSWFFTRGAGAFAKGPWANSRRMAWCLTAFGFATAWIGTGILTSIPGTVILLLSMGWTAVPVPLEHSRKVSYRSLFGAAKPPVYENRLGVTR